MKVSESFRPISLSFFPLTIIFPVHDTSCFIACWFRSSNKNTFLFYSLYIYTEVIRYSKDTSQGQFLSNIQQLSIETFLLDWPSCQGKRALFSIYIYIYIYICRYFQYCYMFFMYIYTYMHTYTLTSLHIYIYIFSSYMFFACIYIYIYVYPHTHINIYLYIYIYIFNIAIQPSRLRL